MTRITTGEVRARLGARTPRPADSIGRIQAAVAIVLAPGANGGLDLLFIKRAEAHGDPWSGQMALPGGRREDADQDLLATAIRETEEETGIRIPSASLLGVLDDLAPSIPVLPPVAVRPFVFALESQPPVTPSPEVAACLWTPVDTLRDSEVQAKVVVRGQVRTVPAFVLGEYVVWGMTHRIISSFMDLAS